MASQPRPRSSSGGVSAVLHPIDEDSHVDFLEPSTLLSRHESLDLTKIGKQNRERFLGTRKMGLQTVSGESEWDDTVTACRD